MSRTGRKRGPYAPTLLRREQISAAVLDLVDELGPESVTVALVAERTGINDATVVYHFPSKDELLVAALERADDIDARASRVDDPDVHLDLEDFADSFHPPSLKDNRHRLYQMIRGVAADPESAAATYLVQRTARQIEIFTRLFEERRRSGLAHPELDAPHTARQVVAMWEGLGVLWSSDPELDVRGLLISGIRRLTGENWMDLHRALTAERSTF